MLEGLVDREILPARAAPVIAALNPATTPEELGMDSLARFAFMGELRKAFGKDLDSGSVSGAARLGDILKAIRDLKPR